MTMKNSAPPTHVHMCVIYFLLSAKFFCFGPVFVDVTLHWSPKPNKSLSIYNAHKRRDSDSD